MARRARVPLGFKTLPLLQTQLSLSAVLKCGQSFRWICFPLIQSNSVDQSSCAEEGSDGAPTHEYRLCLQDRVICLRQTPGMLYYRSFLASSKAESKGDPGAASDAIDNLDEDDPETLAFIRDYFQLDIDLVKLYDDWSERDPIFYKLRHRFSGIRMLRQDPWECLISFICSSNNNISRISKMVQNLCTHFTPPLLTLPDPVDCADSERQKEGPRAVLSSPSPSPSPGAMQKPSSESSMSSTQSRPRTRAYHCFPSPSALASPTAAQTLRTLGFGYRADFIQRTAALLLETHAHVDGRSSQADGRADVEVYEFLHSLRRNDTPEHVSRVREELMRLVGVGRKVADCVMLMSLDKRSVVPIDTHVLQIATKHYGMRHTGKSLSAKSYDQISDRFVQLWGDYAGWAHSVAFTADLREFSTYGLPTPAPTPLATPTPTQALSESTQSPLSMVPLGSASAVAATVVARGKRKRAQTRTQMQKIETSSASSGRGADRRPAKKREQETILEGRSESARLVVPQKLDQGGSDNVSSSSGGCDVTAVIGNDVESLAERVKRRRRLIGTSA